MAPWKRELAIFAGAYLLYSAGRLAAQLVVVPGALVWLYRCSRRHYELLRNTV